MSSKKDGVREPLYSQLKKRILSLIERENLRMLPTEKELMSRYEVSRNTLRRAVLELTREKILQPVQGLGTLVHPAREIAPDSQILVLCARRPMLYQHETFDQLLFMLNNSRLNSLVMMVDHEHIDLERVEKVLKTCDGVVLDWFCSYDAELIRRVERSGKKIVCLRWQPMNGMPYVAENVEAGFYDVTRHLLELGHRRIAFVGHFADRRRMGGIRKAMAGDGLEAERKLFVHCELDSRREGYARAGDLLESGAAFTAVIAHNDEVALGVQERLLVAGKRIPADISVTGFDNLADSAGYPVPLTTCCGDTEGMIREAIAYLFSSRKSGAVLEKLVEPRLVVRESTARVNAREGAK